MARGRHGHVDGIAPRTPSPGPWGSSRRSRPPRLRLAGDSGRAHALSDRLRVRMPLPQALQRFADDLDDASADLIVRLSHPQRAAARPRVSVRFSPRCRTRPARSSRCASASQRPGEHPEERVQIVVIVTLVSSSPAPAQRQPRRALRYSRPASWSCWSSSGCSRAGFLWLRRLASSTCPRGSSAARSAARPWPRPGRAVLARSGLDEPGPTPAGTAQGWVPRGSR